MSAKKHVQLVKKTLAWKWNWNHFSCILCDEHFPVGLTPLLRWHFHEVKLGEGGFGSFVRLVKRSSKKEVFLFLFCLFEWSVCVSWWCFQRLVYCFFLTNDWREECFTYKKDVKVIMPFGFWKPQHFSEWEQPIVTAGKGLLWPHVAAKSCGVDREWHGWVGNVITLTMLFRVFIPQAGDMECGVLKEKSICVWWFM